MKTIVEAIRNYVIRLETGKTDFKDDIEIEKYLKKLFDLGNGNLLRGMEIAEERRKAWERKQWPFIDDLYLVFNSNNQQDVRVEAAERLIRHHWTRRAVFHPDRWNSLQPDIETFCVENKIKQSDLWERIAIPNLLLISTEKLGMTKRLYKDIRNQFRVNIERELTHGRTLDQKMTKMEQTIFDENGENTWPADELDINFDEVGLLPILQGLKLDELRLLGMVDKTKPLTVTERKRKQRLIEKLKKLLLK